MHTSEMPKSGCLIAALSNTRSSMNKDKLISKKKWVLHRMIEGGGQCSKKKRSMNENDVVVCGTSSFMNGENRAKDKEEHLQCFSHGCISLIGRRREMEDAVATETGLLTRGSKEYDFFGVYDGHGGSCVAHACSSRLHKLLVETVMEEENDQDSGDDGGGINWEKVMLDSFKKMDEEVNRNGSAVATITMGSTAVVAVIGEEELVVANCGDSRAVLSRGGVAIPLSTDHKPDRADELERIELSGGKVINWNGQRVLGVLATSRSLGDQYLKPFVISAPQVSVRERSSVDEFMILASDGLWDVIPNDMACHVVRRCLGGHVRGRVQLHSQDQEMGFGKSSGETTVAQVRGDDSKHEGLAAEAASILAELAIARGSRDNISVIVVQLERTSSCIADSLVESENTPVCRAN